MSSLHATLIRRAMAGRGGWLSNWRFDMKDDENGTSIGSQDIDRQADDAPGTGAKKPKKYAFFIGKDRFETTERYLTAAQIKAFAAGVEPGDKLQLEGKGDEEDRLLQDDELIDLEKDRGPLRFTIVPSASFGA
jgi:hypothetical protein